MRKTGTLYGIGVGPGDPELISLKAVRILRRLTDIYVASSTKHNYSLAEKIVSSHLKECVAVAPLYFPMTHDRKKLSEAWEVNTLQILKKLKAGKDAAFVTLGDPMIYSTFGYIMHTIKEMDSDIPIEIIPGITSYQAGAASAGRVLAEGEESFIVISGALGAEKLKQVINHTDSVVMLKVYRNYKEILDTLNQLDLTAKSVLISRCGLNGEEIEGNLNDRADTPLPYLSLLLIRKKD